MPMTTKTVRFVLPDGAIVDYGFGDVRAPMRGEVIVADGSDPSFPAGIYEVIFVTQHVGMRGPTGTVCDVKWLSAVPSRYDKEPS